jgi:uncharacterized membrane protein YjjB (DUF3815 family)
VNEYRFLNTSQPQTLVNATVLLYFEAFFTLIGNQFPLTVRVVIGVAQAAGAFGIANEKRWGYGVALGASILGAAAWFAYWGTAVFTFPVIISFAFALLLIGLLVHPMSRDYQRIWFR